MTDCNFIHDFGRTNPKSPSFTVDRGSRPQKPVWLLAQFLPDWRWMLAREDNPWYPTMKIYRQAAIRDWGSAVARVRQSLTQLSLRYSGSADAFL